MFASSPCTLRLIFILQGGVDTTDPEQEADHQAGNWQGVEWSDEVVVANVLADWLDAHVPPKSDLLRGCSCYVSQTQMGRHLKWRRAHAARDHAG